MIGILIFILFLFLIIYLVGYLFFRSVFWVAEPLIEYFETREAEQFSIEDIDKDEFDDMDLENIPKSKVKVTIKGFDKPIYLSKSLLKKAQKQPQRLGNTNLWIYKDHIYSYKPKVEDDL